jgi:xanthine dehydrogenase accessory factor
VSAPLSPECPSWAAIAAAAEGMCAPVLVTVVETSGSTPRKAGARLLVDADGDPPKRAEDFPFPSGTIGGGAVEIEGLRLAWEAWGAGGPLLRRVPLGAELAMCCGGTMTLFAQPLVERPTLLLFGAGHVGAAVCQLAASCGFAVTVVDDRQALLDNCSPWAADTRDNDEPETLAGLPDGAHVHVLIATRDHALDQRLVEALIERPFTSFNMLGSQRKALRFKARLTSAGVPDEVIGRLRSPAGLDVGAQSPYEIAVAVVGGLIALRRGKA